ncbi:hypothetical protein BG004_005265 [Podila humilis]|nr:hypothetical protein BG004_005265 [Podila humilis]
MPIASEQTRIVAGAITGGMRAMAAAKEKVDILNNSKPRQDTTPRKNRAQSPAVVEEIEADGEDKAQSEADVEEEEEEVEADEAVAFNDEEMSGLLASITNAQIPRIRISENASRLCKTTGFEKRRLQMSSRMRETFVPKILQEVAISSDLPDPAIDDAAVLKAVRLRMNNKRQEASDAIGNMNRTLRIMLDNLLESLPDEVDRSISEATFTVNYVSLVLNSILKTNEIEVHYPNTESSVQKAQGLKPDRPDILVKAYGHEILYGEITGPCRATCKAKTNWDLFRLSRFAKAFLDAGNDSVSLLQVVHESGLAMNLKFRVRGVYVLEKVGLFTVPCSIATIPAPLGTLPVLLRTKEEILEI